MPGDGVAGRGSAAGGAGRRRLAGRRKSLGLTQEALAELIGVERTTVVRWERGETAPLPSVRPRLARALRVSAGRLEELLAPGAPAAGGAGGAVVPRQLPPAVAQFTGRAAELAALSEVFGGAGAAGTVVISAIGGTAGVGKTALAVQWAHQAAGQFPGGQLYVNLRGYDPDRPVPPSDALAGFLRGLGVGGQDIPPEEEERAARYRSLVAGKRVLVVLDNAGSAEQARPLLPGSPDCAVLVTSRDSLAGLVARDGAVRLDLDLLPAADAAGLLVRLVGERAVADPAATGALAERCCRLPLALRVAAELAAARPGVPLAGLAGELASLQERLDLLDAGGDPRTAVRAVFSWSYEHLDDGAARAFRLAGLHPAADFDPYAIAALAGSGIGRARRDLEVLARAHLLQPAGPGRYGMHDLLRAYAAELAETHDGDGQHAALTRLLGHYLSTAATAMDILYPGRRSRRPPAEPASTPAPPFPDAAAAQSWLDVERPTLTAVTQFAARHDRLRYVTRLADTVRDYFFFGGHYPQAILVNASARLAASRLGDPAAEAAAVNVLAGIDHHQGRFQQAGEKIREARDLYRQAGDRLGEARALSNLGAIYESLGRYQQAMGCFKQALIVDREAGDRIGEGIALANLGLVLLRQGRYEQAGRLLRQSLDTCRETGDRRQECLGLVTLALVVLNQGEYEQADGLLRQALDLSRAGGYPNEENMALTHMGDLRRHQGRPEEAAAHLREALARCRELGDRDGETVTLNGLGEVQLTVGQPADARDQHAAALDLATESGSRLEQARARDGLGNAHHALGDTAEASRHWQAALAIYTDLDVPQAARVRARLDEAQPDRAE